MSGTGSTYEPSEASSERYDELYEIYRELYPRLRDLYPRLAALRDGP